MNSKKGLISVNQQKMVLSYLERTRSPLRNKVIFLCSLNGLRVSEISALNWEHLTCMGEISERIELSTKRHGSNFKRHIFIGKSLKHCLKELYESTNIKFGPVILSERGNARMSSQAISNWFKRTYKDVGLEGLSGHSGRRTFATQAVIEVEKAGGSLRDIQAHLGHASIQTTKLYIQSDGEVPNDKVLQKVVDMVDQLKTSIKKNNAPEGSA